MKTSRSLLGGLLAAAVVPAALAATSFDPKLAASPPRVAAASIQLLAQPLTGGNALLRVKFQDGVPKAGVPIQGGAGPTLLRDDGIAPDAKAGDGIFTALVQINTAMLETERERRFAEAPKAGKLPRFDHRVLLDWAAYVPPEKLQLQPGLIQLLDRFHGFFHLVDPARELMVRDPLVVEDPARTYEPCTGAGTPLGAWTFGRLVTEIANQPVTGIDPADLAEHWMNQWKSDQVINGVTIRRRAIGAQNFLDHWPRTPDGRLDLAHAPFRLLAIVNRQDLRTNTLYGGGGAGEARLVFGATACGWPHGPVRDPLPFTVIFEYGVPRSGCPNVRDWARQWHSLGTLVLGSPAYNAALQAITDQFTLRGLNPSRLPNRSALKQVRTNEFALADLPADSFWQLRESRLVAAGPQAGYLEHSVMAQQPLQSLHTNTTTAVRDFVNANTADILGDRHQVPLQYPGTMPFQGVVADLGAGVVWQAPGIVNLEARRKFSLAACDACHTHEGATAFTHIKPRAAGAMSELSRFLTGADMPISTPVSGELRTYNDLLDRSGKLEVAANMSCSRPFDLPVEELFIETLGPFGTH